MGFPTEDEVGTGRGCNILAVPAARILEFCGRCGGGDDWTFAHDAAICETVSGDDLGLNVDFGLEVRGKPGAIGGEDGALDYRSGSRALSTLGWPWSAWDALCL